MRFALVIFLTVFVFSISFSQVPGIKWQKTFGGTDIENPTSYDSSVASHPKIFIPIKGGGYLIAGSTSSNNGDVTGNHGTSDIWVARLDTARNFIWKNCYGGTSSESLGSIQQVGDDGFILIGSTSSNNGNVSGNHGLSDIWVVRLTMEGNILWQRCFGGTNYESGRSIEPTSDGGFILIGTTYSNDGDITNLIGQRDIWVAKLSSSGALIWQKSLGGTGEDAGYIVKEISNGNYVVAGETTSNDTDVSGHHGNRDIWVAQINSTGSVQWQKTIGGTLNEGLGDLEKANDGGFVIAGATNSNDGDLSGIRGYYDGWVVKLSPSGSIQWQKCVGGSDEDALSDIQVLPDGGFVATGHARSNDGDVSGFHGGFYTSDAWIVRLNSSGVVQWTKCIGGTGSESGAAIFALGGFDYIVLAGASSNDNEVSGNHGSSDLWLVGLSSANTIKGTLFFDYNSNGTKDAGEPFYSDAIVTSKKGVDSVSAIPFNGLFSNSVDIGSYTTSIRLHRPYYIAVPTTTTSNFTNYFNTDSISFAIQPTVIIKDLQVNLVPGSPSRPGFTTSYMITYKNLGTLPYTGEVLFKPDSRITFESSSPSYTSITGDTLRFEISNLQPLTGGTIWLYYKVAVPPTVNIGDILTSLALITPVTDDVTPSDDTSILKQRVIGSYDPNDKIENNGGIIGSDYISQGKYLNYTIRFQNTGTDTAFNVIVRDTLDSKLDWSTFEMVTASHPYTVSITNQNKIEWTFSNINLPDSNINEPLSHGYVAYRVKPKSTATVGDVINNLASIYFDYNLPVATNNALTLVQDNFTSLPVQLLSFTGQLSSNTVQLNWRADNGRDFERFEIERSVDGRIYNRIRTLPFSNSVKDYSIQDNISALQSRHIFYRLKLIDADGKFIYSRIIPFNISADQNSFILYPNPARSEMYISLSANRTVNLRLKIIDASGRIISDQKKEIQKGNNIFSVNTSKLNAGNYILQFVLNGEIKTSKFTIMN